MMLKTIHPPIKDLFWSALLPDKKSRAIQVKVVDGKLVLTLADLSEVVVTPPPHSDLRNIRITHLGKVVWLGNDHMMVADINT